MKKKRIICLILAALCLLPACGRTVSDAPTATEAPAAAPETEEIPVVEEPAAADGEYVLTEDCLSSAAPSPVNARVFYEIFVGSFSDSDGDGIGDLRGIINRMDYLNDGDPASGKSLGVEGIWLSPVYESLSYHKYDVNDYYNVDRDFGTNEDLKELIELCHERDVKVILDLPINHTGPINPWYAAFQKARRAGSKDDYYYNFFSCYDTAEGSGPEGGKSYTQVAGTGCYVESNFSSDMPELNYDNPAVRQAVLDVAKFWLNMGVDGFRFDAIKYIYFNDDARSAEFWQWYMDELRALKPDVYAVGECWSADTVTNKYYGALDCFNFTVSQAEGRIAAAAKKGDVNKYTAYVDAYLNSITAKRDGALYMPFIANHDTDRAAGYLTVASGFMQMGANLYILGPGSPFLYYGEELGIRGSRGGANTDANRRLAMIWGDGDTVKDPEGSSYGMEHQIDTTAVDQQKSAGSLYTYYKKLIAIRRANPEIAEGEYTPLPFTGTKTGGFVSELNGSYAAVIHNPSGSSYTADLRTLTDLELGTLAAVIGMEDASLDGTVLTIGGQTSVVLRK